MKAILQKQTSYLKLIADNTSSDNLIQKAQFAAQLKTDEDIKDDDKKTQTNLISIKEVLQDSYKKSEEINDNVIKLSEVIQDSIISSNKSSEDSIEKKRTEEKVAANEEKQTSLIKQLLEAFKKGFKEPKEGAKLGGLGTGLATVLGTLVGAIQGHIKAVIDITKFLTKGITSSFKFLFGALPADIQKKLIQLKDVFESGYNLIKGYLTGAANSFKGLLKNASTFLDMQFTRVVKFLGDIPFKVMTFIDDILLKLPKSIGTPIMKFIDDVVKFIGDIPKIFKNFIDPVIDGFKSLETVSAPISNAVTKVTTFVKSIFGNLLTGMETVGSKLGFFADAFGAVSKIAAKIAYPLTIVMAVWDTVKGTIEGFEKDGIVGAIKGAITGLFNSLVGGLLDMVKSGISWIAGALGFTAIEKALDSFSFQDLFKGAIDSIFEFMTSIGDWISSKIEAVKNFFGFGTKEKKENAQQNLKDAREDLTNAQAAATVGAIGVNDKGGVMTSLVETNGRFDREGARSNLESEGYREMTEDERNAYIEEKKKRVNDAEAALKQVDQIPTLEKIWNDFNFADAISTMISKMFGTIPDLIKGAASWVAGKLGFDNIKKYLDSFSFTDIFKEVVDTILHPIDALTSLFNRVADGIEEYLVTPVTDMISDVKNLFKEYVSDPLKKHFEPISKFFSKMKDDILNMFSNFGIPEISFEIPVIGKKVSIGPFYPFKDSSVTTSKTDTKSSSTSAETSSDSTSLSKKSSETSSDSTNTSSERVRESSSTSLIEKVKSAYTKVKDSYGRGVSGTLDYQNRYDEINKRAIEQGIIDEGGTGRILDIEAYNKIEDQVLSEIGEKTANPSMMSEQLLSAKNELNTTSRKNGRSEDSYRQSLNSTISSEKSLFGSTLLGSLVSEKGLKTGNFISTSSEEISDKGKSRRSINDIFGRRISGGLFSGDKYELSSGKERLDVSKEQYNRVQDLVKAGKAKEAEQEYTRVKMELEAKDNNTAEMLDPEAALIQSAALEKSEPRVLPIYEASKKNEDEKAAVQQNQAPVVISAPTTNNVSNNKQSIVMPTPVRQEDTSVMSYNRRGHAWSVY